MALSVGGGLGVVHELMAAEVDEVVGPKGKHDRDRSAKRHGHEQTSVCLGARRAPVCGLVPEGYNRWSLRLLADRLVTLEEVDAESVSHETIRRTLKK